MVQEDEMLNEEEKAEDQGTKVDEEESTEPEKQGKKAKKKWVTVLGNPTKCLL